jgi:hypothetical protein
MYIPVHRQPPCLNSEYSQEARTLDAAAAQPRRRRRPRHLLRRPGAAGAAGEAARQRQLALELRQLLDVAGLVINGEPGRIGDDAIT